MTRWLASTLIGVWIVTSPVLPAAIPNQYPDVTEDAGRDVTNDWGIPSHRVIDSDQLIYPSIHRLGTDLENVVPGGLGGDNALNEFTNNEEGQGQDKRAFNPWGGKRAFNPWGGKRAFQPWGGKRAFSPWGGKRSMDSELSSTLEEAKRTFPHPWGGKRAFTPWGGKRNSDQDMSEEMKRAFNPWGGKRAFNPWGGKRAFSPWGGKRSDDEMSGNKRQFTPWGGKRASFNPWGGKRTVEVHSMEDLKRAFSPWGGKRTAESVPH